MESRRSSKTRKAAAPHRQWSHSPHSGERLVGTLAKRQAVTNPENTIFSIKRFMGRKEAEVKEEESIVPYKVVRGENGDVRVDIGDKQLTPAGDLGDDPAEAQDRRRGLPR